MTAFDSDLPITKPPDRSRPGGFAFQDSRLVSESEMMELVNDGGRITTSHARKTTKILDVHVFGQELYRSITHQEVRTTGVNRVEATHAARTGCIEGSGAVVTKLRLVRIRVVVDRSAIGQVLDRSNHVARVEIHRRTGDWIHVEGPNGAAKVRSEKDRTAAALTSFILPGNNTRGEPAELVKEKLSAGILGRCPHDLRNDERITTGCITVRTT